MSADRTAQSPGDDGLAAGFAEAAEADWLALVEKALKGADFERTLNRATYDGFVTRPLYVGDAAAQKAGHGEATGATDLMPGRISPERPWHIEIRVDVADPAAANAEILEALENGASAICLSARNGLPPGKARKAFSTLLDGVRLELVPVAIEAGPMALALAAALVDHCSAEGHSLAEISGTFGFDPLGDLAASGSLPFDLDACGKAAASALRYAHSHDIWATIFDVRTQAYHLAGASDAQELAFALATAVDYLRALEKEGLNLREAAEAIGFTLTADASIFSTVAKLRAARLIWARALEAAGISAPPMSLGVETAERMMSRADPHVNILRTTAATLAAGIGGADTILLNPHDSAGEGDDPLARRIARNAQLVIQSEAHAGRVVDPAAGSWYVEALTAKLTAAAWQLFQEIEATGGMAKAIASGIVAERVSAIAELRGRDIARRALPLTGVSEFPDLGSPLLPAGEPAASGAGGCAPADFEALVKRIAKGADFAALASTAGGATGPALQPQRLAASFESLRDAAEGSGACVFAATLGTLPEFGQRLAWLRNALAAGGVATAGGEPHESVEAMAGAFAASGASVAVLCAPDATYAEQGQAMVEALRKAGAKKVLMAGRPAKGGGGPAADAHIFAGCDIVSALRALQADLGIGAA